MGDVTAACKAAVQSSEISSAGISPDVCDTKIPEIKEFAAEKCSLEVDPLFSDAALAACLLGNKDAFTAVLKTTELPAALPAPVRDALAAQIDAALKKSLTDAVRDIQRIFEAEHVPTSARPALMTHYKQLHRSGADADAVDAFVDEIREAITAGPQSAETPGQEPSIDDQIKAAVNNNNVRAFQAALNQKGGLASARSALVARLQQNMSEQEKSDLVADARALGLKWAGTVLGIETGLLDLDNYFRVHAGPGFSYGITPFVKGRLKTFGLWQEKSSALREDAGILVTAIPSKRSSYLWTAAAAGIFGVPTVQRGTGGEWTLEAGMNEIGVNTALHGIGEPLSSEVKFTPFLDDGFGLQADWTLDAGWIKPHLRLRYDFTLPEADPFDANKNGVRFDWKDRQAINALAGVTFVIGDPSTGADAEIAVQGHLRAGFLETEEVWMYGVHLSALVAVAGTLKKSDWKSYKEGTVTVAANGRLSLSDNFWQLNASTLLSWQIKESFALQAFYGLMLNDQTVTTFQPTTPTVDASSKDCDSEADCGGLDATLTRPTSRAVHEVYLRGVLDLKPVIGTTHWLAPEVAVQLGFLSMGGSDEPAYGPPRPLSLGTDVEVVAKANWRIF
ncbi:MAG: hypothetical protein HY543_04535 [Deltaproteobacteria bacterium]|nr:hypothetical protein [Deltaproteobacteria bacterium]